MQQAITSGGKWNTVPSLVLGQVWTKAANINKYWDVLQWLLENQKFLTETVENPRNIKKDKLDRK